MSDKEEKIKTDITSSKGIGEGKNWYFNLGGIMDDSSQPVELDKVVKFIPLGELIQKMNMDVKSSENLRNNILSAHRVTASDHGGLRGIESFRGSGQDYYSVQ